MKCGMTFGVFALACCLGQQVLVVAVAQDSQTGVSVGSVAAADSTRSGSADGVLKDVPSSPAVTGERRPLYRLRKSDVVAISFTFAPEFDQNVSVQPDGFITLKGVEQIYVEGTTVPALRETLREAYSSTLHDPEVTIALKDFDKPYFIATGQIVRPGKYELRADITVTEAVAIAGGFNEAARHSQVVLFRRVSDGMVESHLLDVKSMLKSRDLKEDMHLKSGDLVFVPQNAISKIRRYLPTSSMGTYMSLPQF
ncbi:MAG TPA: polysaccharide biosynthesis/export family protein [Terriglobales bacterium]|nr:polysaccharide biosynthesis/export family protein [Terriglobales bacterium]